MSFKQMMQDDMGTFYNLDEFAIECTFKGIKVPIFFQQNEIDIFDVPFERIKGLNSDFLGLQEGDEIEIDSIIFIVLNFSPVKDFQINISIRKKQ